MATNESTSRLRRRRRARRAVSAMPLFVPITTPCPCFRAAPRMRHGPSIDGDEVSLLARIHVDLAHPHICSSLPRSFVQRPGCAARHRLALGRSATTTDCVGPPGFSARQLITVVPASPIPRRRLARPRARARSSRPSLWLPARWRGSFSGPQIGGGCGWPLAGAAPPMSAAAQSAAHRSARAGPAGAAAHRVDGRAGTIVVTLASLFRQQPACKKPGWIASRRIASERHIS